MEKKAGAALAVLTVLALLAGIILGGSALRPPPITVTAYTTVKESHRGRDDGGGPGEEPASAIQRPSVEVVYLNVTMPNEDTGCKKNIGTVDIILQGEDREDGAFSDRVDVERESVMLSQAAETVYIKSTHKLHMPEGRVLLSELFDRATLLRNKIEEYSRMTSASARECMTKATELWINYRPKPADGKIIAVDSGWNYRLYTGFYVYALKAAAVDRFMNVYYPDAEVGILAGDPYEGGLIPDLFLKYTAEGYEHNIAFRAADRCDLVLVDGSLIARLKDVTGRDAPKLRTEYFANTKPLRNANNIAFVSKYSHDKSLLGGVLGDIFYINMA